MNEVESKENKKIILQNFRAKMSEYQTLYDDLYNKTEYGKDGAALKNFHAYEGWIIPPFCDLGCGRGHIVKRGISKGQRCHGYDWINIPYKNMEDAQRYAAYFTKQDITKPMNLTAFKTAICIDVLEHLDEVGIKGVLKNMSKCEKQVVSVSTIADKSADGLLHITVKDFEWWDKLIADYLQVVSSVTPEYWHKIYFCRCK